MAGILSLLFSSSPITSSFEASIVRQELYFCSLMSQDDAALLRIEGLDFSMQGIASSVVWSVLQMNCLGAW